MVVITLSARQDFFKVIIQFFEGTVRGGLEQK